MSRRLTVRVLRYSGRGGRVVLVRDHRQLARLHPGAEQLRGDDQPDRLREPEDRRPGVDLGRDRIGRRSRSRASPPTSAPRPARSCSSRSTRRRRTIASTSIAWAITTAVGARKVATVTPSASLPQNQPNCLTNAASGLIDCGNWAVSASWTVPADAVSGIYFAKLDAASTPAARATSSSSCAKRRAAHVGLPVPDLGHHVAGLQQLRRQQPVRRRPGHQPGARLQGELQPAASRPAATAPAGLRCSTPSTRWCGGSRPTATTSATSPASTPTGTAPLLLQPQGLPVGRPRRVLVRPAARQRRSGARAPASHLAFFSGNEVFWKTRWETQHRRLAARRTARWSRYKETHANAKIDPAGTAMWTGTWRDPRFSPPADGGRPENALTGTLFTVNDGDTTAITVPGRERQDAVLAQHDGRHAGRRRHRDHAGRHARLRMGRGHRQRLPADRPASSSRSTTRAVNGMLLDYGSTFGPGTVTHNADALPPHRAARSCSAPAPCSGRGASTASHDRGIARRRRADEAGDRQPVRRHGRPAGIAAGGARRHAGVDRHRLAPTSTITAPAAGASFVAGTPITITGTAVESGGGSSPASRSRPTAGRPGPAPPGRRAGRSTGRSAAPARCRSRAAASTTAATWKRRRPGVDDHHLGVAHLPVQHLERRRPCRRRRSTTAIRRRSSSARSSAPTPTATSPAVRFYKAAANTGSHTGSLWSATGTQLATVTFSGETASGWQQDDVPQPGRDHRQHDLRGVVSRAGRPLHGHRSVLHDGGRQPAAPCVEGRHRRRERPVCMQHPTSFPANTFDVRELLGRPRLHDDAAARFDAADGHGQVPGRSAISVDPAAPVTATFSEAMDPATISSSTRRRRAAPRSGTFELRGPSSTIVNATVTYNATSRTATLVPADQPQPVDDVYGDREGRRDRSAREGSGRATRWLPTSTLDVHDRRGAAAAAGLPVLDLAGHGTVPIPVDDADPSADRARHEVQVGYPRLHHRRALLQGGAQHRHARRHAVEQHRRLARHRDVRRRIGVRLAAGGRSRRRSRLSPTRPTSSRIWRPTAITRDRTRTSPPRASTTGPLHALKNGVDGPNGVYKLQRHERLPDRHVPVGGLLRRRRVQPHQRAGHHAAFGRVGEPVRRRVGHPDDRPASWRRSTSSSISRRSRRRTSSCGRRRARPCPRRWPTRAPPTR